MRRTILGATVLTMMAAGGYVSAQAPTTPADDHAAHHPAATVGKATPAAKATTPAPKAAAPTDSQAAKGGGMMGGGAGMMNGMCPMMGSGAGGGMVGGGMMGGGMMGGGMMGGATKVDVKKVDKGVTITMTSPDAATAARLQKMAEAMRLMHEATAQ